MNKEARLNLLCFGIFLFVIVIASMFFVSGWYSHVWDSDGTQVINYSEINTVNENGLVNEDMGHVYNITINNTGDTDYNITSVNITLWGNFEFSSILYTVDSGSNGTGNLTIDPAQGVVFFNMTNIDGVQTLSWNTTSLLGAGEAPALLAENMTTVNSSFFWFNATAATPGKYNITVRITYNQTATTPVLTFNETNITVHINDTTKPWNVNVSGNHTFGLNRSYANVSGTIIINVSAYDNGNLTVGDAEYDVIGVNISFFNGSDVNASYIASNVTNKYWNVSIDTTTLNDGVYNITIIVNDTNNNINITNISNLRVDNTKPTGSVSCTPTTVNTGDTVTCTCSVSDALSGENTSATSIATPSTVNTGTHTMECSFSDMAGNANTASGTYTVELATSGGTTGGGPSAVPSFTYSKTIPTSGDFSEIKTIETSSFSSGGLKVKERVKIKLNEEEHYIGVRELTGTSATIEITSDPVQVELDIGEDAKVDLNDDNIYDVYVKLNGIAGGVADLTITYLQEEIPEGEGAVSTTGEDLTVGDEEEAEEKDMTWLWILIIALVLAIIIGAGIAVKKNKQ